MPNVEINEVLINNNKISNGILSDVNNVELLSQFCC